MEKRREGNVMSAECGNVFFRDSSHDLFFKTCKVLLHSLLPIKKKKGSEAAWQHYTVRGDCFSHSSTRSWNMQVYKNPTQERRGRKHILYPIKTGAETNILGKKKDLFWRWYAKAETIFSLSDQCNTDKNQWLWIVFSHSIHFIDLLPRIWDTNIRISG